MTTETAALILARGGSKGLPSKNLARVGGLTLLARSIRAARSARGVGSVWVSTDDAAIASEARTHGARVIDRPAALSGDGASSEAGWLHALPLIEAACGRVDRLVLIQCTSPFTLSGEIERGLHRLEETGAACALSVAEDHGFLWGEADGVAYGLNHDHEAPRRRRQDLSPQYRETGAFYIVDTKSFTRQQSRFCGPVTLVITSHPPLEIDGPADLVLARAIAAGQGQSPDPERLTAIRAVVMDFDGVHSDDRVMVDQDGRESVMAHRGDGLGLSRLRAAARHQLLILSKERNPVVMARSEKLRITALQGVDDKVAALEDWLATHGLTWTDVLYVGNDINDAAVMAKVGLAACPSDARPEILAIADWVLPSPGGKGALRAMSDALLAT